MQPKVSEVLMLARDKIIDGYVPREPRREQEDCAVTALCDAVNELYDGFGIELQASNVHVKALKCLVRAIDFEDTQDTVVDWSDSGPKQKVIDGFDAAIRLAKERESE